MDKMRMESVDLTAQNIEKIGALFLTVLQKQLVQMESLRKLSILNCFVRCFQAM